ncbi:hypothetical protein I5G67_gp079 [Mycobacterium phage Aminay]|uniref:Uncharacterized protein n=1 Tax=Mycobacterium phage Aminay TaxID=2250291 RepID=A0A345KV63_9CAUD|nr:hypothetical protein I5G67_gp079 [Mycobacterium phage Aminay]AXH46915.1 hypothetical protein SEA_AMINAY_79 [Mycobacterium phage Aminay]
MTTTMNWTKAEAKASDAEYARLTNIAYDAYVALDAAEKRAMSAAGATMAFLPGGRKGLSLDGRNKVTLDEVRKVAAGEIPAGRWGDAGRTVEAVAKVDEARAAYRAARDEASAWDAANYRGWPRFFLVPDGHIHASTRCSSLYITTQIGWLPELSGETEAEAVAAHGAMLCTKCFPSAPVEYTRGKVDPSVCAGSGTWDYPSETARTGYCAGNYGVCSHCGERITISSTGKMRKHKRAK